MGDLCAFVLENYTTVHHRCPNTVAGQLNPTQLSFGDTCAWRDRAQNGKKHCGLSPTDTMLILLPEVMKPTGGWQEGRKHHCTVAPSSIMLLLLRCHSPVICHRRQHCQTLCRSHRESSNISIYNPKIAIHAHF